LHYPNGQENDNNTSVISNKDSIEDGVFNFKDSKYLSDLDNSIENSSKTTSIQSMYRLGDTKDYDSSSSGSSKNNLNFASFKTFYQSIL
jgi:hypothetical protein